jgi:hypothetical protein
MEEKKIFSSFRDPSGYIFSREGIIYRQVNNVYKDDFDLLVNSGLYKTLVDRGLLISHSEEDVPAFDPGNAFKIIRPERISFISYPYEWSFSQLKDAALATLMIQKTAMEFGMSLKDCSAYNIQFHQGRPVLIDTLSFKKYSPGRPWIAYRQYCQHFLAPLALMALRDVRFNQLLRIYIDGIPLDLAMKLLPLKISLFPHIHLHALSQGYFQDKQVKVTDYKIGKIASLSLIDNLESAAKKLVWKPKGTVWGDYYDNIGYSTEAFEHKKRTVSDLLDAVMPRNCWDIGANIGVFSRIAADKGIQTVSIDSDPAAVEKNYRECAREKRKGILPLLMDLTNPSPGIGWQNEERVSFADRGPVDVVMALALIHHLVISDNLTFDMIAKFFSGLCRFLIIEFIPKDDPQVRRLLSSREDIFGDYSRSSFEQSMSRVFLISDCVQLQDSGRILYLMEKKQGLL